MPSLAWIASQPACSMRELVQPQLARVEEPEQVDLREVALAQRAVLVRPVLAHVPRVARALLPLRREREHVRRGDVGDAAGPDQVADPLEHRVRVLDVLDRLQEHDAVDVARPGLDHVALEAQARARVLQPRVLERVRVGVDADDRRGAAGEHVAAVALPAREVDHAAAVRARRDPLVDDEVAPEPVVLLRHVRQRALPGEVERRHALGLVALDVELGRHGARTVASGGHGPRCRDRAGSRADGVRERQRPLPAERPAARRAALRRLRGRRGWTTRERVSRRARPRATCTPEELLAAPGRRRRAEPHAALSRTPMWRCAPSRRASTSTGRSRWPRASRAARAVLDAAAAAGRARRLARPTRSSVTGIETLADGPRGRGDRHAVDRPGASTTGAAAGATSIRDRRVLYAELAEPLLDLGPCGVATAIALACPVRRRDES